MTREEIEITHCLVCGKETQYCMCGTLSTTGVMPWDDLFDCSLYIKTQVKMETTVYEVIDAK